VAWIFGYGSLLAAGGLPAGSVPCALRGHRRCWGVAMDNRVDLPGYKHYLDPAGRRPPIHVAFLDLRPDPAGVVHGAAFPVAERDLPLLDARERNYVRVPVAVDADVGGPVHAYAGSAAGRARLRAGLAEGSARISRAYAELVEAGFAALGRLDDHRASTDPEPCPRADLTLVRHELRAA
jgi:hypothetical protein